AVAAVLIGARLILYIGAPADVSQSNDAPFHLGAVRAIIEAQRATSFGLGGLVDPEAPGAFYPGAWHGTTALVSLLSGAGVAEATNVMTIVVGAIVWPLGIAWLAQAATGRRLAAAGAAALSPALLAFPLLLVQYGILYSYLLAVALVPAAIAAVVVLARREPTALVPRVAAIALVSAMSIAAIGASQPSALLAWGLAVALSSIGGAVAVWRDAESAPRSRALGTAGATGILVVLLVAWWGASRLVTADYWGPVHSLPGAVLDVASSGYAGTQAAWWVSVLLVVGLAVLLVHGPARWLALTWVVLAGLYVVAAAIHSPWLRLPLVGPWYSDTYRLAALLPVVTLPVAAAGVVFVVDRVSALTGRRSGEPRAESLRAEQSAAAWVTAGALLVVSVIVFAVHPLVQRYHVANGVTEEQSRFVIADDTWLTLDERALLERLPDSVEPGARVLGNPGTGAAFGYALSGVDVFPAKWQLPRSPAFALLGERLVDAAVDPEVCAAADALDAQYVLDFGPGDEGTGRVQLPGLTGFEDALGFELVDREGAAALWRITACS
ncbi:MAG TPA: DUF6541 family protein, partial [Microbacterium sp.]|nr:DUF6541 family protein [Microbacterium sp.]